MFQCRLEKQEKDYHERGSKSTYTSSNFGNKERRILAVAHTTDLHNHLCLSFLRDDLKMLKNLVGHSMQLLPSVCTSTTCPLVDSQRFKEPEYNPHRPPSLPVSLYTMEGNFPGKFQDVQSFTRRRICRTGVALHDSRRCLTRRRTLSQRRSK